MCTKMKSLRAKHVSMPKKKKSGKMPPPFFARQHGAGREIIMAAGQGISGSHPARCCRACFAQISAW